VKYTLERLDVSHNLYSSVHEGLCNMDKLKVLMLHGNLIKAIPKDIGRIAQKIEEIGLEWWQYIYIDEATLGKKEEGVYRDDTIVTNRQILRQIFETVR
jgi:Leucine-rich repeat (LRR) protein